MNLILLSEDDFVTPETAVLRGRRCLHLQKTLRAEAGDTLRVGRVGGRVGRGTVAWLSSEEVHLDVLLDEDPPPKLPLTLLLALPRPKRLSRILRAVAEIGVPRLILINAYRVEKSYWQSPFLTDAAVEKRLREGLEQARDTIPPLVEQRRLFKPFVEDELPAILPGTRGLVAHPGVETFCPSGSDAPTTLAIGPEGGFLPYEVAKLEEAGMTAIHLGPRILSVETAVTTAVAKLFHAPGERRTVHARGDEDSP